MRQFLQFIFMCLLSISTIAQATALQFKPELAIARVDLMNTFYQEPSFSKFELITTNLTNHMQNSESWQIRIIQVFTTMVLYTHPSYTTKIVDNFSSYSPTEKALLYCSLNAIADNSSVTTIKRKYHYSSPISACYMPEQIKRLNINDNADSIDQIWSAFFATGDSST